MIFTKTVLASESINYVSHVRCNCRITRRIRVTREPGDSSALGVNLLRSVRPLLRILRGKINSRACNILNIRVSILIEG